MRVTLVLIAVLQAALVAVWSYQLVRDQRRPRRQRWVPRHWPLYLGLQVALAVAALPILVSLGD